MSHRTQIYLSDEQYDFIKKLSNKEGKSMAQIIRNWIDEKFQNLSPKKKQTDSFWQLRGLSSDKPTVAENFDDYLYGDKK